MQPPAAQAPGHSSSHNVCVSSDLPTTTWFSHSGERLRLTISLTNERVECVRGQAHSLFAVSSSARPWAQFSLTLSENISSFPPIFFLCHVWGKKHVVSIVKFSRCSAAGVVSSGLWLAGDYYLKTWKSDRHKGKSALARLSTWGKSDASEVVQNEEETLKDVFFPFLLNVCQASTDLPETWTCGLNACLFVFSLLCFIQVFLVPLRVLKGGIFYFRQLCLSNCSHYSALTMCIILHTRFKEKHIRPPKVVWSLTLVLKYFRLWREIPVFA